MKANMDLQIPTLLNLAQNGDRSAFDQLVTLFEPRIVSLIGSRLGQKLKGQLELEDIKQEALLRAFRSIERFHWQGDDSFMRWFGGIVEHVILGQKEYLGRRANQQLGGNLPPPVSRERI